MKISAIIVSDLRELVGFAQSVNWHKIPFVWCYDKEIILFALCAALAVEVVTTEILEVNMCTHIHAVGMVFKTQILEVRVIWKQRITRVCLPERWVLNTIRSRAQNDAEAIQPERRKLTDAMKCEDMYENIPMGRGKEESKQTAKMLRTSAIKAYAVLQSKDPEDRRTVAKDFSAKWGGAMLDNLG